MFCDFGFINDLAMMQNYLGGGEGGEGEKDTELF